MFYAPDRDKPVPLIVALHTWSGDYRQTSQKPVERWCIENGWAYLHPNFRGPNRRPQATGSELVVGDILSAVAFARRKATIDANAIYLVGASGGGYTALLMAGRHPKLWAGVSAWAPITDLAAWHEHCSTKRLRYARDIEQSCGGKPGQSEKVDREYKRRSPLTHLPNAKDAVDLHINTGIRDGHAGSVPISHSLRAFNAVAEKADRLGDEQIERFTADAKVPEEFAPAEKDASYGRKAVLFRRRSARATITIFQGGHEIVHPAALAWIHAHHAAKTAKPPEKSKEAE